MEDIRNILNSKTLYIHLACSLIFAWAFVNAMFIFIVPFIYWSLFGEGATSERIASTPLNMFLGNYGALIIGLILTIAWAYKSIHNNSMSKAKSYLITAFSIVILYPFRSSISDFIFSVFE
jgi:hypothetical protein